MFLISFVLVLGLVSSAFADTYDWTNDYPWSMLYISPWNWDGTPPYGGPGIGDTARMEGGPAQGPVLDTDIEVYRIRGPQYLDPAGMTMYLIKDCNLIVNDSWEAEKMDDGIARVIMADDAKAYVDGQMRTGDEGEPGTAFIFEMSDNAFFETGYRWRTGDNDSGVFELYATDNAVIITDNRLNIGDDGSGVFDFSGSADVSVNGGDGWGINGRNGSSVGTMAVSESATVWVDNRTMVGDDGSGAVTMTVSDVAEVNTCYLRIGDDDVSPSSLTITDSATVIVRCCMRLRGSLIDLLGGTLETADCDDNEGEWLIHICGGVMIIEGDAVDWVEENVAEGHILGCSQESCITPERVCSRADIVTDYDNINPGRTTVWAEPTPAKVWCEEPPDGSTDVPSQGAILCWCLGEPEGGIKDQHVFLSTDKDAVDNRLAAAFLQQNGGDNCVELPCLDLCATYYWAVDTQDHFTNIIRGDTYSFTTECCRMIEPFDEYTTDPWSLIYKAWYDGCGYWDVIDGEPVLISNGTGSCVNLGMDNTQDGAKAMIYTYENDLMSLWERDHNYSEATHDFDPALDLDCSNEAALVVYFYGDGENDLTDMWLKVGDGTNTAKSIYGANGEDPANIQIAEWRDWNTELTDLAAVDLSAVTEMALGFGDDVTNVPDGTYGLMLFDSISVCPVRCVPQFVEICDLNDDCVVDWKDVKLIGDNWLEDRR
jgi:hypothetical protein